MHNFKISTSFDIINWFNYFWFWRREKGQNNKIIVCDEDE